MAKISDSRVRDILANHDIVVGELKKLTDRLEEIKKLVFSENTDKIDREVLVKILLDH